MTIVKLAIAVQDSYRKTAIDLLQRTASAMIDSAGASQYTLTDYPDDSGDGLADRTRRERRAILTENERAALRDAAMDRYFQTHHAPIR